MLVRLPVCHHLSRAATTYRFSPLRIAKPGKVSLATYLRLCPHPLPPLPFLQMKRLCLHLRQTPPCVPGVPSPPASLRTLFQPAVLCCVAYIINSFAFPMSSPITYRQPRYNFPYTPLKEFKKKPSQPSCSSAPGPIFAPLDGSSLKSWLHPIIFNSSLVLSLAPSGQASCPTAPPTNPC